MPIIKHLVNSHWHTLMIPRVRTLPTQLSAEQLAITKSHFSYHIWYYMSEGIKCENKTKSPNNFLKCAYNSKNIFPTKKILQYVFIYTIQAIDWYTIHLIIYIKSCPPEMSSMSSRNVLQLSSKISFGGQLEDIWRTMAALIQMM